MKSKDLNNREQEAPTDHDLSLRPHASCSAHGYSIVATIHNAISAALLLGSFGICLGVLVAAW